MDEARKRELRKLNLRVWAGEDDVFPTSKSLDSSLKKNTAFIKRIRTALSAASQTTLISEVQSLSLHKYLSEIISACYEGLCKLKTPQDIAAAVEVVSALHQRFGNAQFTAYLAWYIGRGMSTPDKAQLKALSPEARDKEERERLARHRILLRVLIDLWLVAVLRSLDDISRPDDGHESNQDGSQIRASERASYNQEPYPLEILKDILGHDREHMNLPLVVMVAKTFASDLLGVDNKPVLLNGSEIEELDTTPSEEVSTKTDPLASSGDQERFKNILVRYFDDVKKHIVKDHTRIAAQNKRNAEAYVKSGEIFEDRQANFEKLVKDQDRLVSNAQVLADILALEMPDLTDQETAKPGTDGSVGLVKTDEYLKASVDGSGLWEDAEHGQFYESLLDIKSRVPAVLLEDKKKQNIETTDPSKREDSTDPKQQDSTVDEPSISKTVGAQVDALLARLPELLNKDQADQCAIDFCFLNSKASRNRLVKTLQEVPRGRVDLLPLYSRLVATLTVALPDVATALVSHLDDEFRSLQRRKSKDNLGPVRMMNVRYLSELTKFDVVPEHVIFHCLKVGLDDFTRMNIEIIAGFLENCGRYLFRKPESRPRMTSFLQALQRKKGSVHLGQQERMLVENAVYFVDPPERASIVQEERTPMDLYVRKLIYTDLCKRTLEEVTKQLRKLHWEEPEVVQILCRVFAKPGELKYGNMHLLAVILGSLHRYHQDFAIGVMDDLLERIYAGLDHHDFRENQERTADVRFLGELYVYRLVDSAIIMDTLYGILIHDHPDGYPRPAGCPSDTPNDFFRIRLVASLLEVCGMYFDKGQARQKLDFFLSFYQYYICTKENPPMEVDFVVQDIFAALRPQWKILTSLEEASTTFAAACKQKYGEAKPTTEAVGDAAHEDSLEQVAEGEDQNISSSGSTTPEHSEGEEDGQQDSEAQPDPDEDDDSSDAHDSEYEDEEEQITVIRPEEVRDPEAEAEFDRELAKLMADSYESRKTEKRQLFDVPLPLRRNERSAPSARDESPDDADPPAEEDQGPKMMTFSLLSKRGNRQQTRSVALPSDSNLAKEMRSQQEAERAEQQRIKSLVLNYDMDNASESTLSGVEQPSAIHHSQSHRRDPRSTQKNKYRARRLQLRDVDWT